MTSGGYVGLSLAVLLAQHHQVTAVDIVPEKVELINNKKSPIQDDYMVYPSPKVYIIPSVGLDSNPSRIPSSRMFFFENLEKGFDFAMKKILPKEYLKNEIKIILSKVGIRR